MADQVDHHREQSMLMRLPKELRLLIIEFLLADSDSVIIGQPSQNPWKGRPRPYHPPLARASCQLRSEALSLLYRKGQVIIILRYCEGREQVREWLEFLRRCPVLCENIRSASIQFLERPHRSTAIRVDTRTFCVLNRASWVHPLSLHPLPLLETIENFLHNFRQVHQYSANIIPILLQRLIEISRAPLVDSRLLQTESMANLRVHGYTDFALLTEIIGIVYQDC